ncbi:ATP-dependent RNA helicase SUPV3L1/SUV3 [Devosia sp. YR412]|uniref:helicase-related protein n=1 Tax=Devosia sp. YR412 TaxID=1881030 RepID=UPI0008C1C305|nr:helicase-related protein [Devosia sp. YR412]SEQ30853.1 ATP-dependent RNA helicase SUPV3L1/SUV3 [Devosia sp. YR412]
MTFAPPQSVKAILGPTNTGKTYYAIERMLAHPTGMIGLPLRLLAREVYQRCVERVGEGAVALVTGEERIVPPKPRFWVCTVEAMPMDIRVDCVAIDEIQTAIDFDRGHVFTDRILNARGSMETLLLGAATMAPIIRKLLPHAEIIDRPRFSQLTYAGSKKISRQPTRSAIVAFSARQVYAIAELIRRERGGAAVVMGALSPRTRNAQVELYQNGDVDFLVATDAIGMGLNLDIHHVAFADDHKFDGRTSRELTPAEIGQIAGRAGRHARNGTFGVTGGTDAFDEELVVALETHDFAPVKVLQWRNNQLDFSSIAALQHSLDASPEHRSLTRVPIAKDQQALEFVSRNEAGALARGLDGARLLWECCQIPDYQGISPAAHGEIVTKVYTDLVKKRHVNADWIAEQVRFCDNTSGDIDTLSNRIKQIRTWTFVANRKNWLADPSHWREKTRDIEDRLSDALHERLTQRFVDRRTSVLLRHLKDKRMASSEINERGEVRLEGHLIGTLEGFRFTLARNDGDADIKGVRTAADQVVAPEIHNRADRLAGAPNEEFVLATDGKLRWKGDIVAELIEGDALYRPRILMLADESLTGVDLERVQDRLSLWLRHHINTVLEGVMALEAPADLEGTARGIAYQLYEHIGLIPRAQVADDVKNLDQDVRGKLRKLGIKFGAYHIYLPLSLKPAPRELALILFALKNGGVRQAGVTDIPHIVLSGRTSFVVDPEVDTRLYETAGFKVAGKRAVRVDILERLADIIRPLIALDAGRPYAGELPAGAAEGNGFRVTVEMTSLLGCSGEDFASILNSLGYKVKRTPKVAAAVAAEASAEAAALEEVLAENPASTDAVEEQPVEAVTADAVPSVEADIPATTIVEAAAPSAEAEPAVAAEPEFDEVWSPAGKRPDNKRHGENRRRPEGETQAKRPERNQRPSAPRRPEGEVQDLTKARHLQPKPTRPEGRPARAENRRPDDQKGERARFERPAAEPRKEKTFDPDSPFAKLLALKAPKGQ